MDCALLNRIGLTLSRDAREVLAAVAFALRSERSEDEAVSELANQLDTLASPIVVDK